MPRNNNSQNVIGEEIDFQVNNNENLAINDPDDDAHVNEEQHNEVQMQENDNINNNQDNIVEENDPENVNNNEQIIADEASSAEILERKNAALVRGKLDAFNQMYGTNIKAESFVVEVSRAFDLISSEKEEDRPEGREMLSKTFKSALNAAFEAERLTAYDEYRLPEYTGIIKSANELLRASLFAFTDLYTDPAKKPYFDITAFGGLDEKEMAKLTAGDSPWSGDQRTDEAWEHQSREAVSLADKWSKEEKSYEMMRLELLRLAETRKEDRTDLKSIYNKLAAAEYMLLNNPDTMIQDPDDPSKKMPNWENRYWKQLIYTREALGIPKFMSMRDMIQGNYAAMKDSATSVAYNEAQIKSQLTDPEPRAALDSMQTQTETFTIQRESLSGRAPEAEKKAQAELAMTSDRMQFIVKEQDERFKLVYEQPKSFHFVISSEIEHSITKDDQVKKQDNPVNK